MHTASLGGDCDTMSRVSPRRSDFTRHEGGEGAGQVEIGWWLVRAAWGLGYASEAAGLVLDEGFHRLGLDRIIARVQPANVASSRVAQRIGLAFDCEATGRHGERLHIYSLDKSCSACR